jgi:hypothetical protein
MFDRGKRDVLHAGLNYPKMFDGRSSGRLQMIVILFVRPEELYNISCFYPVNNIVLTLFGIVGEVPLKNLNTVAIRNDERCAITIVTQFLRKPKQYLYTKTTSFSNKTVGILLSLLWYTRNLRKERYSTLSYQTTVYTCSIYTIL